MALVKHNYFILDLLMLAFSALVVHSTVRLVFTTLVFTTSGGMGPLCTVFVDHISERIADHNKEAKSQVKNHIRTRFRFDLLRSTLIAHRGIRGRQKAQHIGLDDVSFNLIPQKTSFEVS